jgi:hypothetical protein
VAQSLGQCLSVDEAREAVIALTAAGDQATSIRIEDLVEYWNTGSNAGPGDQAHGA